ncbi:molybdopterin molybdenumtransferase MoeA, partial [Caulobacter sp. HMWF025]
AELFLRPLLAALSGTDPALPMIAARLARPLPGNGPRAHWMRASLSLDAEGRAVAEPFGDQDSSLIGVFARANALMTRPAHAGAAEAGDLVQVLPLGRA